ncbi:MAG: hypothetical protein AAF549_04265 [Pseudomonadota bacterium]
MKRVAYYQSGSAFIYILIAIALLAALTASFMRPASQQTTAQNTYQAITSLKSQIDFIQSSIQECVLTFPAGDDSDTGNIPVEVTQPYPFSPTDDYFQIDSAPTNSPAATETYPNNNVEFISCPGNPGNSKDHRRIFGGVSGKFLPPPPELFEPWEYYNGEDGIFIFTETDKTDSFIQTALAKLDEQFSECQADVIDASGSQVDLTSAGGSNDPICSANSTCFRVWLVVKPTATYNGDSDGEESSGTPPPCP